MRKIAATTVLTALAWNLAALHAADVRAVPFKADDVYSVESTETLRGHIDFKKPGADKVERLPYRGERKTRYIERVLAAKSAADGVPERVLRVVATLDSTRKIGDMDQMGFQLRDAAKHVVLHRGEAFSKPFSLKGPLKQEEIHTLSHLVFVPALNGLLPQGPLVVGAQWTANRRAVAQLAGLVPLESGDLSCTVKNMNVNFNGRSLIQVAFTGVLMGMSEEGRVSDDVVGSLYLDRTSGIIHSLTVEGIRTLYDEKHKAVGRLEMEYKLAVRAKGPTPGLDDSTAIEAAQDPTPVQTAVLYEFPPCAVRLVHPRAWALHDATHPPRLEFMYAKEGHQLTMNFHEDDKTPSVQEYFKEVSGNLKREKFEDVVWTIEPSERTKSPPEVPQFKRIGWFEATAKKDGDWRMRYMVWQVGRRGVTIGVFMHSKAARDGRLADDANEIIKRLEFTGDRNPFFVKPKDPPAKASGKR